jgi:hypothetical protein
MPTKHPKQPTDEAMKAKALSRWEGEGGALAPARDRGPKAGTVEGEGGKSPRPGTAAKTSKPGTPRQPGRR